MDDGYDNVTVSFWFETLQNGTNNTSPTVECFIPDNESTGYNLSGYTRVWVNDTDGNDVNITWRTPFLSLEK